jgi:hypothetical protein
VERHISCLKEFQDMSCHYSLRDKYSFLKKEYLLTVGFRPDVNDQIKKKTNMFFMPVFILPVIDIPSEIPKYGRNFGTMPYHWS